MTVPNPTFRTCASTVSHGTRNDCTARLTLVSAAVHAGVRAAKPASTPRTRNATETTGIGTVVLPDFMNAR
ncbi:hypothetical protein GCM10022224_061860 [Nonomuraea antimicrobica]|uniref:Uncharacterized protein n=1 Tax=Nonomuraea antimicrobica TaxID=561173 RepID=A0ABP7CHQ3_9ACTN